MGWLSVRIVINACGAILQNKGLHEMGKPKVHILNTYPFVSCKFDVFFRQTFGENFSCYVNNTYVCECDLFEDLVYIKMIFCVHKCLLWE
jgi:hypothetical protein